MSLYFKFVPNIHWKHVVAYENLTAETQGKI